MRKKIMLRLLISVLVLIILYSNLIGISLLELNKRLSNSPIGTIAYHLNRISSQVNRLPYNQKIFIESALMAGKTDAALDSFYNYIITTKPDYISNDSVLRKCMVLALKHDKEVYYDVVENWVSDQVYFIDVIITNEASTVEDYEFALRRVNELLPHADRKIAFERMQRDLIELLQGP